jgi:hypothetical protein
MDVPHIDLLSVLIAAIVNGLIGAVWYSRFLFGNISDEKPQPCKLCFLWNCIVVLITAYILAFFETFLGVTTVSDGMFVGFLAWLGFVATTQIYAVIWSKMNIKHFLVHTSCQLLSFLAMGGIIGA